MLAPIEGILFLCGEEGITKKDLINILEINEGKLEELLKELNQCYLDDNRGIKLECFGNICKLVTKKEHNIIYSKLVQNDVNKPLSNAALEVLAIIAYNQPITRVMVDEIRGVSSSHMVRRLLVKELIKECGKSDLPGRPNLYQTTDKFLDCFGIKNLNELPKIEENEELEIEEKDLFSSKYVEKL